MTRRLMWHGTLLVLARLCIGLVIPYTATPRVTLGAHVCTIMNGLLVALAGILWPHLRLSPRGQIWTAGLLVSSGYVLSASLFLGGVTGAGSRRRADGIGLGGNARHGRTPALRTHGYRGRGAPPGRLARAGVGLPSRSIATAAGAPRVNGIGFSPARAARPRVLVFSQPAPVFHRVAVRAPQAPAWSDAVASAQAPLLQGELRAWRERPSYFARARAFDHWSTRPRHRESPVAHGG